MQGDDLRLAQRACHCVDHLLAHYLRTPVAKARMTLASPDDFDVAVARLADQLQELAGTPERDALQAALKVLDVEWGSTTAAQRRRLVSAAQSVARSKLAGIAPVIRSALQEASRRVVEAVRNDARDEALDVGAGVTAFDARVMRFLTRSETLYVTDASGRWIDKLADGVRTAVAEGMAEGLGRSEIQARVANIAASALLDRSQTYWQVVAGAFVGRGRSYAQVGSYQEAGVDHYRIVAVMDERTSAVCRAMHGKVMSVARAVQLFERAEAAGTASALKNLNPWPRNARETTRLTASLSFPPYHGLCRTTTVAVT